MKDKDKKYLKAQMFDDVGNKEKTQENCINILRKRNNGSKKKSNRRALVFSTCLSLVIAAVVLAVVLPLCLKQEEKTNELHYYLAQTEIQKYVIDDPQKFIDEKGLNIKYLPGESSGSYNALYDKNSIFIGIEEGIWSFDNGIIDYGFLWIYDDSYIIDGIDQIAFNVNVIDNIDVKYLSYELGFEYAHEILFEYNGYKYYFKLNSGSADIVEKYFNLITK